MSERRLYRRNNQSEINRRLKERRMEFIRIEVAQNNEAGLVQSKISKLVMGNLWLECTEYWGTPFFSGVYSGMFCIKVVKEFYPYSSLETWFGNRIYNAYTISRNQLRPLLNELILTGIWRVDNGPSWIYERFEQKQLITDQELSRSVISSLYE